MVEIVRYLSGNAAGATMTAVLDAFRGSLAKSVREDVKSIPQFGAGSDLKKSDAERLLKLLVRDSGPSLPRLTLACLPRRHRTVRIAASRAPKGDREVPRRGVGAG